ncbi:nucleotidyltransferase family protein [Dyadobacter sandarakinus]|uniref:NTP transferase domain-containing protein n=1 Tax=Dyadobacter sandarakinus TaxID=2747268 RepID=A0ABX7IGA9_9BACT|nr:NTP transferase domain-containing protein [Dyadobacter sandarakinus]QRR03891.1 NTP transferase domain-containing protein [Dyadobacter sandarakinus]
MNYAIIAAGEGSRLAREGFQLPKPMVSLHGEMLIDRLIRIFMNNNATTIRIIINEQSPALEQHMMQQSLAYPIEIVRKTTPSSLHSMHELLASGRQMEAVCVTTTDTVFREEEFAAFIRDFENDRDHDGHMAVTSFIDDESPLFVATDESQIIRAFEDKNSSATPYVSGGIYCLRQRGIALAGRCVQAGVSRMRNFQREMLQEGLLLKAYPFSKIVDVDHVEDIRTAELFLQPDSIAPAF